MLIRPNVPGATTVGVPDEEHTGKLAGAYMVPRLATNRDTLEDDGLAKDIKGFDGTKLACLDVGVFFVNEIPQNAMSKTVKGKLIVLQEHYSLPAA